MATEPKPKKSIKCASDVGPKGELRPCPRRGAAGQARSPKEFERDVNEHKAENRRRQDRTADDLAVPTTPTVQAR